MSKAAFLRELWDFLKKRKLYWMAPIIILLLLLGALILFTETSAVAPSSTPCSETPPASRCNTSSGPRILY